LGKLQHQTGWENASIKGLEKKPSMSPPLCPGEVEEMIDRLRHSSSLFIWLSLVVLILLGCAGPGKKLEPPRITLANIQVQEIKLLETAFQIELIEIKGLDCQLELNDKQFASGVSNKKIKVPPYDSATIPITVYSSVMDLARGILDSSKKEKIKYKLKGRVRLGGGLAGTSVVPFESEGELSLPDPTGTSAFRWGSVSNI
jgi:LEA14-like dessication related protein